MHRAAQHRLAAHAPHGVARRGPRPESSQAPPLAFPRSRPKRPTAAPQSTRPIRQVKRKKHDTWHLRAACVERGGVYFFIVAFGRKCQESCCIYVCNGNECSAGKQSGSVVSKCRVGRTQTESRGALYKKKEAITYPCFNMWWGDCARKLRFNKDFVASLQTNRTHRPWQ